MKRDFVKIKRQIDLVDLQIKAARRRLESYGREAVAQAVHPDSEESEIKSLFYAILNRDEKELQQWM